MSLWRNSQPDTRFISRKAVWGWALYDWANSAFSTTVMAGFFPIFFKTFWSQGVHANLSTARLGFANAAAGLIVALIAPILGAIADGGSARKKFLIFFAYQGALMSAALFWIPQGAWQWAVFIYVLGVIGFSSANIFYDALLPSVAGEDRIDIDAGISDEILDVAVAIQINQAVGQRGGCIVSVSLGSQGDKEGVGHRGKNNIRKPKCSRIKQVFLVTTASHPMAATIKMSVLTFL